MSPVVTYHYCDAIRRAGRVNLSRVKSPGCIHRVRARGLRLRDVRIRGKSERAWRARFSTTPTAAG